MIKLTFLKLEGLRGSSYAPRHIGDFEVTSFTWSHKPTLRGQGPNGLAQAKFNHLSVYKRADETSAPLKLAYSKNPAFATGELVVEELSAAGQLLRTTAYKMRSIVLEKMSSFRNEDEIGFTFESMSIVG